MAEASETPSDLSRTATIAREATRAGVILGTAACRSPEQAPEAF
ncbi:MAG: hypothetical protein ACRD3M_03490 [Thermoanaerobaculia bacterium]